MKTLSAIQSEGYLVERKVSLKERGPYGTERRIETPDSQDLYVRDDVIRLCPQGKTLSDKVLASAREAIQSGADVVLTPEDFVSEPLVMRSIESEGEVRYGGVSGHDPYREKRYLMNPVEPLTDFVRHLTSQPRATWAIHPQVDTPPDVPGLYIFVPVNEGGPLSQADAERLVLGKVGELTRSTTAPPANTVRVDDDSVYIGDIRVDRHNYITHWGDGVGRGD